MPTTEEVLADRGARYGKFETHAEITQVTKNLWRGNSVELSQEAAARVATRVDQMHADQIECLEMIAHKVGRILNGDPHYGDSWRDISGYAKLVADRLEGVQEKV